MDPASLHSAGRRRRHAVPPAPVNQENFANQISQALPFFQGDVRTLIQFFRRDSFCSPGICTCEGINLPPGEVCGENWYTRIVAMTRVDSPIRQPLIRATNIAIAAAIQQRQEEERRRQRQRQQQQTQLVQLLLISQVLQ